MAIDEGGAEALSESMESRHQPSTSEQTASTSGDDDPNSGMQFQLPDEIDEASADDGNANLDLDSDDENTRATIVLFQHLCVSSSLLHSNRSK